MIRAAAKNHAGVVVLVDPGQYAPVLEELRRSGGTVSPETRQRLALEAFRRTAQYDAAIAAWLRAPAPATGPVAGDALRFPPVLHLDAERVASLRYGENPHQRAAFYRPVGPALGDGRSRGAAAAPRSRAVLQQPARPRRGARPPRRVHRAGGGRGEAHESVRRGGGVRRRHGVRAGAGVGSGLDLRRGRRRQPTRRPRARGGAGRHSPRDPLRAGLRAGGPRGAPTHQEEAPRARASGGPAPGRRRAARAAAACPGDSWSRRRTWSASTRWPSTW